MTLLGGEMFTGNRNYFTQVFLSLTLTLFSSHALANPPWASNYEGEVSFKLNENPQLANLQQIVRQDKQNLEQAQKSLQQAKVKLQKQQERKNALQKELNDLNAQIATAATKKQQLETEKQALPAEIANLQQKIQTLSSEIATLNSQLQDFKSKLATAQQNLQQAKTQCNTNPTPACQQKVQKITERVNNLTQKITTTSQQIQNKTQAKNKAAEVKSKKETRLANIQNIIAKQNQIITQSNQKKTQTQQALQKVTGAIATSQSEVQTAQHQVTKSQNKLAASENQAQNFRQQLIARILDANAKGAQNGMRDGRSDGQQLAYELGLREGRYDGSSDGNYDGTTDGKRRDYQDGYGRGENEGSATAQQDGQANGTKEGTIQGNIDAATIAGKADGTTRAQNSDASQVGTAQGKQNGMERAIGTGKKVGTAKGQEEAISKYEDTPLAKKTLSGKFAGAFSRNIPSFPTGHRGNQFNPNGNFRGRLMNQAYSDGYHFRYRRRVRNAFENNIAANYNQYYDEAYRNSYDSAYNVFYQADYDKGRDNGYNDAYQRVYPVVYDRFYQQYRTDFRNNPNTSASEYKRTYSSVEQTTYDKVYEQIRYDYYVRVEQETFDANIQAQTKKFRDIRFAEVENIYQNSPVLKYISTNITDGGLTANDGSIVAAKDGIYQPTESVYHDLVINNYSLVSADNVKVVLSNGQTFEVPSVPAKSQVTVKGVAKSSVGNQRSGSTFSVGLSTFSPVTREGKIQARHFSNPAQGQINSSETISKSVQYPLTLSGLKTKNVLVINESNRLVMEVKNNSLRNYQGNLEIQTSVDSQTPIITKGFAPLQSLGQSVQVSDAIIDVKSEADTYTPLTFTANISKKGVKLGFLSANYTTMAKAPYVEKMNSPVIVANSELTRTDLVDTVQDFGGIANVSVLDVSLPSKNASVMNAGLKSKVLLMIDNGSGSTFKSIEDMATKSENSVLVALDDASIVSRVKAMSSFRHAIAPTFRLTGIGNENVVLSNPLRDKNHKVRMMAFRADRKNYQEELALAKELTLNNDQVLAKVGSLVNENNFFNPTREIIRTLQAFNLKVNHDVLSVNDAYMESGSLGSRNTDIAELVRKDGSLLHNKLAAKSKATSSAGMNLVAYDTYWSLKALNDHALGINLGHKVEVHLFTKGFGGKKAAAYELKRAGEKRLSKDQRKMAEKSKAKYRSFKYDDNFGENSNPLNF